MNNKKELIEKFAKINNISYDQALSTINGETIEDILNNIKDFNLKKIYEKLPPLNRAQKRKLLKKIGSKGKKDISTVADTAEKFNYIELIQKLRELNKKENKNGNTIKDN